MKVFFKKRILVLGDYRCTTGFATVTTNILREVKKYFGDKIQFDIVAINWYGDVLPDDYQISNEESLDIKEVEEEIDGQVKKVLKRITIRQKDGTSIYSAYYHDGKGDVFGRNAFLSFLNHINYTAVFIVQDIGTTSGVLEVIRKIREERKKINDKKKKFKVIYYFPKDSTALLPGWFESFDVPDHLIAYTYFAKNMAIEGNPSLVNRKIPVIYHGVNTADFKKLPTDDALSFRQAYFGKNTSKFIVSNINRNQFRKDIPTTMMAFKKFYDNLHTKPFLYLHMNPDDMQGWSLRTLAKQLNLVEYDDFMFTPEHYIKNPPEPGFLNCIYNASDVYLTTTTGEGFGLTILEAMMAQVPVIAPVHTSIKEIGGDVEKMNFRIFPLHTDRYMVSRFDNIIRPQAKIDDVVDQLTYIHDGDGATYIQDRIVKAYEFARGLSWNEIGKKWIDIFKQVM